MKKEKQLLISENASIKQAILKMKKNGTRTVVVADAKKFLQGTLSEGDIQKALIKNISLSSSIKNLYNKKPKKIIEKNLNINLLSKIFIDGQYGIIPIVNDFNKIKKVITWDDIFNPKNKLNILKKIDVVIMAGGVGERLKPFTKILPKPLVPIDNKPMLEHIIENFSYFSFKMFHLILNHQADLIKSYFRNLKNNNVKINFVKESKPLGTAGGISLIKKIKSDDFIIGNCDTLFRIDYLSFYQKHKNNSNLITLVVSKEKHIFPYGACKIVSDKLVSLKEKPKFDFITSTGLYFVKKEIIKLIPKNKLFNMTDLINKCLKLKKKVGVYQIQNHSWTDLGQLSDFNKASKNY